MLNQVHRCLQRRRVELYALTLFVVLALFMLEPLNMYLAWSLLDGYGLYLFVVLMAFYLYFRGVSDGPEITLALLFVLWHALSRILNGDVALKQEGYIVIKGSLMVCMLSLGPVLSREQRRKALRGFGLCAGLYFTLLGVMALYSFVTRRTLRYALTDVTTGIAYGFRMVILGYNPNTVGFWYLLSSAFLVYLILDCRRKFWRIPLSAVLILHYLTLAASYSRNAELCYSLGAGLLAALLLRKKLPARGKKAGKIALLVLTVLAAGLLCFKGFALGTNLLGRLHDRQEITKSAAVTEVRTGADEEIFKDPRSLTDDSQRLTIYKTLPEVFRREPLRLLRGCLNEERMSISNTMLPKQKDMMHNTWLEILNYLGIPGFLLLLAFTVLMLLDCARLYFSASPRHTTATRFLALPAMAGFCFSILESFLWYRTDFMTLSCYLFMGFVIAELREERRSTPYGCRLSSRKDGRTAQGGERV